MKRIYFAILLLIIVIASAYFYWFGVNKDALPMAVIKPLFQTTTNTQGATEPTGTKIEKVATNLEVPWSIVWTSNTRMLIAERPGRIRQFDTTLAPTPLLTIPDVATGDEEGLMGLAVDPEYDTNHYLYYCYAYTQGATIKDRVVRVIDQGDHVSDAKTLIEDIPAAKFHAGCQLGFGPDKKLYITTGDATKGTIAQDLESLGGKILRIDTDGSIPSDNPFPNSPVWSYGHRNPQGIAWNPQTKQLFETEHGPSGWDGPGGGDELNLIQKGNNYGWPIVSHTRHKDGMIDPLTTYTPAQAPAAAAFYTGDAIAQFEGVFFFAALKGESLHAVRFGTESPPYIQSDEIIVTGYGRIRAVAVGPDGYVYFSTSNRDGRGTPQEGDDQIIRIVPTN